MIMDWIIKSQNLMALIAVPIAISTVMKAQKNWPKLWDEDVTSEDRSILMSIALFVIMPVIVFFHECGHAAATLACGGQVQKFFYGFLWGYVIPSGNFTEGQILWIYLAGNLAEIALGLVALIIALRAKAPAVVTLSIYVAFWAVGGTLIFYTLLSVLGAYGDWIAIYSSPLKNMVVLIGAIHAVIVGIIIWAAYSKTTTLWFARKTHPDMVAPEKELLKTVKADPSADNLLQLAWFYYRNGAKKIARTYSDEIEKDTPHLAANQLLDGWLCLSGNNLKGARRAFDVCADNLDATDTQRARAIMGAAICSVAEVESRLRGATGTVADWSAAVALYSKAHDVAPDLGDPLFHRGELFTRQHLYNRAENDFRDMLQLKCLDPDLFERAEANLAALKQIAGRTQ
jgi:tetratricopeptide (TPR) repeat protein